MRRSSWLFGALLGAVTGMALLGLLYLGQQAAGLPFVPFDFFDWLARALPGGIISLFIHTMVDIIHRLGLAGTSDIAKAVERASALAISLAAAIVFGAVIGAAVWRSSRRGFIVGLAAGAVLFLLVAAVEVGFGLPENALGALVWLAVLIPAWGALLGWGVARLAQPSPATAAAPEYQPSRRAFLLKAIGASLAVAVSALGLGRLLEAPATETGAGQPLATGPQPAPTPPASPVAAGSVGSDGRILPASGTRPELTPTKNFYTVDINLFPPTVKADSWHLETSGLFDRPRSLTLEELQAFPAVTETITLSCISNPVGGDLISTASWTGLRLRDLLEELGFRPEARALLLASADGFHETVVMADMMDPRTMLVYGMNGATLPVEHGFPLRILIPNRYGMKQPKWIVSMEASETERPGYWVERGWSKEARPQIVSVIDTIAKDDVVDGRVPIGGIAWAGDRGIQKVEVEVDRQQWYEAALRVPPLGPLTWVQWRFDWPVVPGRHPFRVRATDGTGALQIEEPSGVQPDGATGYQGTGETVQ